MVLRVWEARGDLEISSGLPCDLAISKEIWITQERSRRRRDAHSIWFDLDTSTSGKRHRGNERTLWMPSRNLTTPHRLRGGRQPGDKRVDVPAARDVLGARKGRPKLPHCSCGCPASSRRWCVDRAHKGGASQHCGALHLHLPGGWRAKLGTNKTVKARFWPWLQLKSA